MSPSGSQQDVFGKQLVGALSAQGWVDAEQVLALLDDANSQGISFVNRLTRHHAIDGDRLAVLIARQFGFSWIDLDAVTPPQLADDCPLTAQLCQQYSIVPLLQSKSRLVVGFADPVVLPSIETLQTRVGMSVETVVVSSQKLQQRLSALASPMNNTRSARTDASCQHETIDATPSTDVEHGKDADTPVIRFVDRILSEAAAKGASDVHIEPGADRLRVRLRRDGRLQHSTDAPLNLAAQINSRIKVLADLDITERRKPQDGRLRLTRQDGSLDFRVSSIPTIYGEKLVLRVLHSQRAVPALLDLGMETCQRQLFQRVLDQHQGMILVTGPTGSGKSVTLYAALQALNSDERNLFTVEDPVEITLPGLNQVGVNKQFGVDFACALKAFLRQDPDIIMLGEIRDQETADIAVKAAQTGHLLLSTLHTNSAADAVNRLLSMGVAHYNLSSALSLVIAQRLCRKLCEHCKTPVTLPVELLNSAGMSPALITTATLYRAVGCQHCVQGFRGRTAVFELIRIGPEISALITAGAAAAAIREVANNLGYMTLQDAALHKVARGITTLDEARALL